MASPVSSGANAHKPSFAKIAAAGMKPPNTHQNPIVAPNDVSQHVTSPSLQDGSIVAASETPHSSSPSISKPKKLVQLSARDTKEMESALSPTPHVQVDTADAISPPHKAPPAPDGMLMPSASEDAGTMISSSDGDAKPPSLDGKSVASGTTFALDEKESLRPDDSASVQAAAEDEDNFTTSASGLPSSRMGSDEGTRAFREQLHEIQEMEPSRRQQPGSTPGGSAPHGVLYVPPQGPGIGAVPSASRPGAPAAEKSNATPDGKLLEALENPRDRIWVLKLEQDVIDFVKDPKETSLNLPQCNSFYRMLAHKIADYYLLGHSVDEVSSAVRLYRLSTCRIPPPLTGIVTPSTAASTPPPTGPQMKILRRGVDSGPAIANGSNMPSSANSENGDSGDDKKKPVTREEREARYEAARLRIMGSSKPTESPDGPKEKDDSRSSSVAGKKSKKKHRDNSDDGFEARSAYTSHFAGPYAPTAYQQSGLSYQTLPSTQSASHGLAQFAAPEMATYQQYGTAAPGMQWPGANSGQDASQQWYQSQNQGYDLSQHFGNAMSVQNMGMPNQNQNVQSPYGAGYPQQQYTLPGSWQAQAYTGNNPAQANGYATAPTYPSNIAPSPQQIQYSPQYPFGQLPSQAMGRPPNALEHPVPGSYKSPHFNPQSQSFVPTQASSPGFRPSMPQRAPTNPGPSNNYGMSYPLERQMSAQSQTSSYGSPHPSMHNNNNPASRMPSQPLTHPLPQPVFPRQPSPNVPLPPKPVANTFQQQPHYQQHQQHQPAPPRHQMANTSPSQNTSSIAKWGTPASLPAKPPPSNEPFDPQRFAQAQRTPGYNGAAASRLPNGSLQGLGGVPSMAPQAVLNGSYSPGGKRM